MWSVRKLRGFVVFCEEVLIRLGSRGTDERGKQSGSIVTDSGPSQKVTGGSM